MATDRYNVCSLRSCRNREWVPRLFDALLAVQQGKSRCICGAKSYLWLEFYFGNGLYPHPCKVLEAFLPDPMPRRWQEKKYMRTFYPFLVIVESIQLRRQSAWFPYWHIDTTKKGKVVGVKYGQWASFMRADALASLTSQARGKGYKV